MIVPAYNEEVRIVVTLQRTLDYLEKHHPEFELIVADDGSTDGTADLVTSLAARAPRLRLLRSPRNQGKGAAVRRGMLDATGRWRLFMDADLSTPIEELEKLLGIGAQGFDVVIGSRGLAESDIRERQPFPREAMGRTFNAIVRVLLMGGYKDTQCGFKLFSAAAAEEVFSRQTLDGFAFDVENLLLARELGYRVKEVPIIWYHAPNSKVSPITDSSRMLRDLIGLRLRAAKGRG